MKHSKRHFSDPNQTEVGGRESGETTRWLYDDLDDYNGYSEAAGAIYGSDGALVTDPAASGLSRTVSAAPFWVSGQNHANPANFMQIIVTVSWNNTPQVALTRLVYNVH